MKQAFFSAAIAFLIFSCNNKNDKNSKPELPAAATGPDAVIKAVTGKKYKTERLALISNLKMDNDNPYEWFDENKDTSAFFRDYKEKQQMFALSFVNDTLVEMKDESGITNGTWTVDAEHGADEEPGNFLRLEFIKEGESIFPGQTGPTTMTYTYRVIGINEKQIFLQTPKQFNNRKLAVLMSAE